MSDVCAYRPICESGCGYDFRSARIFCVIVSLCLWVHCAYVAPLVSINHDFYFGPSLKNPDPLPAGASVVSKIYNDVMGMLK